MAKLEDLIAQLPNDKLRAAIAAEVRELKRSRRFGLVFEEHLPETVRLPKVSVRVGHLVARRREDNSQLWKVKAITKGMCTLEETGSNSALAAHDNVELKVPAAELVVVSNFGEPVFPHLVPADRISRGDSHRPWHTVINADNFHALQLLLYAYERKVDVIYIDPPYNSGARDWKYNNDYVDRADTFRHSKWLSMMKKRLALAKRLLRPDGVLIIAIDENELNHLGMLLETMFPEYLRHMITAVINPKGAGRKNFARTEEHLLFWLFADSSG